MQCKRAHVLNLVHLAEMAPKSKAGLKKKPSAVVSQQEPVQQVAASGQEKLELTPENVHIFKGEPLEKKLDLYREWASKQIDNGNMDYQLLNSVLKKLMDANHMSLLWGRLRTAIKKSTSAQVKDAWDKICERGMRDGKTERKNEVLCIQLALGNSATKKWEDYLSEEFLSIATVEAEVKTAEWMYYGAMEKKHGKDELDDMIAKGKLETCTDRWGDRMYRRKRIIVSNSTAKEHKATIMKKARIEAPAYDKMEEAVLGFAKTRGLHVGSSSGCTAPPLELASVEEDDQDDPAAKCDEHVGAGQGAEDMSEGQDKDKGAEEEQGKEQGVQKPKQPTLEGLSKQLTDKLGVVIRCVELLAGKTLAKAIRDKLLNHQDRIPVLAKELLRLDKAQKQDKREISKKTKEAEKVLSDIKHLVALARPHIQKRSLLPDGQ